MKKLFAIIVVLMSSFLGFAQGTVSNGTLSFPEGTTEIKNSAYIRNLELKHIKFPSSLKKIGNNAFKYCAYIDDDLVLPDGLESIGATAFYNCVNIHKITVPASVTTIGNNAFCKNASLVVKKNSQAHKWAVENGYDFQFTANELPSGVTEVYQDFFMKTAWDQRGGDQQFTPNKQRVKCGNLADATIMYYNGLDYRGSKSYASNQDIYFADFDKDKPNLSKMPRIFLNTHTDEQMYDVDLLLWYQCVTGETSWEGCTVHPSAAYTDLEYEHMPAEVEVYFLN